MKIKITGKVLWKAVAATGMALLTLEAWHSNMATVPRFCIATILACQALICVCDAGIAALD
jgi:hypothetical protein